MQKLITRLLRGSYEVITLAVIIQTLQFTAYCHTGNPTASGVMPKVGHCAVDKINGQWVKFGTRLTLPDGRELIVTDRFGDGRNNACDIFMATESECWQFGRQVLLCKVEIE